MRKRDTYSDLSSITILAYLLAIILSIIGELLLLVVKYSRSILSLTELAIEDSLLILLFKAALILYSKNTPIFIVLLPLPYLAISNIL